MNEEMLKVKVESLKILYTENAISYRYFLDWRHKVFLRFGVSFGLALVIGKYILDSKNISYLYLIFPLMMFSLSSTIYYFYG